MDYPIATVRWINGERSPPVRKLAEKQMVDLNTVARAYREHEMEKAIVSRSGSAVFVDGGDSPLAKRKKQNY
ncbi:GntR family transcriptional regulator [bacterium]|nr:GntR family transcriptional regulator [bacterium]